MRSIFVLIFCLFFLATTYSSNTSIDFNGDKELSTSDILIWAPLWDPSRENPKIPDFEPEMSVADLNNDGYLDEVDIFTFLHNWYLKENTSQEGK